MVQIGRNTDYENKMFSFTSFFPSNYPTRKIQIQLKIIKLYIGSVA